MNKNKKDKLVFKCILLMHIFCMFCFTNLQANNGKGRIKGIVLDENGQIVVGAHVILNPGKQITQTNNKGLYSFNNLYFGTYSIEVNSLGHSLYNVNIDLQKSLQEVNIKLQTKDSQLDEVVVAEKKQHPDNLLNIERSAMPVTIITRQTIELMGSRRLDEVLKEQTGMAIVNNISGGARSVGVQMQGFGSEYVMILIDGQPMAGRNDGNFDLSRISVSNIERIEIIKGASSCLFGSDALGGAVNIITKHGALQPQALASVKYGSLNILDATLEGETPFANQRGSINLSANYYRTDGFNTDPLYITGVTAPPYDNYSLQGRSRYRLTQKSTIGISGRYALRKSFMPKDFGLGNVSEDSQDEKDLNLSTNFNTTVFKRVQSLSRYYYTRYSNNANVAWQNNSSNIANDIFIQNLHRVEQQFAYSANNTLKFTAGIGAGLETMANDIYVSKPENMYTAFAYLQGDWRISSKIEAVGGLRYDHHNNYNGRLNPSLGIQYHLSPKLTFKIASGTGYKAPDFKSRYLVFYNPTADYMVIGSEVLQQTLTDLQNEGQISEIREYLLKQLSGNLKPEKSNSINIGFNYNPSKNMKVEIGTFYHKISDQINSIQVATGINNRRIFTYQNLPKVVNKGLEASVNIKPYKNLELGLGYQYLDSKDLSVIDSIKVGAYHSIRNNQTGETWQAKPSDYWGIENRAKHMLNFRAFYQWEPLGINANIRINYRGKYPFGDANNNKFIDKYDSFVDGYFLINTAIEKKIMKEKLSIQITADNIMNYIDRNIPGQPGRVILVGLNYRFYKN